MKMIYKKLPYDKFVKMATQYGETFISGNYKLGNKMYHEIHQMVKESFADENFIELVIKPCLKESNYYAQYLAAIWLLLIKKSTKEAQEVLKELAARDDIGIIRLNSDMTLKTWQKQGYLKL